MAAPPPTCYNLLYIKAKSGLRHVCPTASCLHLPERSRRAEALSRGPPLSLPQPRLGLALNSERRRFLRALSLSAHCQRAREKKG